MTQDEVIELAKRVGFPIQHPEWRKATEEFAALVAEKEREANAKMVDHILKEGGGTWGDAIRTRGQA